jgi:hypothetical protein
MIIFQFSIRKIQSKDGINIPQFRVFELAKLWIVERKQNNVLCGGWVIWLRRFLSHLSCDFYNTVFFADMGHEKLYRVVGRSCLFRRCGIMLFWKSSVGNRFLKDWTNT